MLHSGLVSITFRNLPPAEIVALVAKAGLEGIEWGGDVHVPHGNLPQARLVRRMTEAAGLTSAAYGSYYLAGAAAQPPFEAVLETALELKAPIIRVWAGEQASADANQEYFDKVVRDTRRIAGLAAKAGISIAFEFHSQTLTDTYPSALKLLKSVAADNVTTYWQPPLGVDKNHALQGLKAILPWLSNIHAFYWGANGAHCPLAAGASRWKTYLQTVAAAQREHFVMLEFVKDDAPKSFLRDAQTLRAWLGEKNCAAGNALDQAGPDA